MERSEIERLINEKCNFGAFMPTDEERKLVYELALATAPMSYIAARVRNGIKTESLKKTFHKELTLGYGEANGKVIKALYKAAVEDSNVTAMIAWVSKNPHLKWTEKQETLASSEERIEKIVLEIA